MGSMALVVRGIVVAIREVPAAPVVDIAVSVVVEAVRAAAGAVLPCVDPDVRGEVGMREVDARVDDGDDDIRAAGRTDQASRASMSASGEPAVQLTVWPKLSSPQSWLMNGSLGTSARSRKFGSA